jgi:dihydroxyacetone kinase
MLLMAYPITSFLKLMSSGKHFINKVEDPVERGLKCLLRQDHFLRLIESEKVLYRRQSTPKVQLLSGGGSGHEPTHTGYLGEGMLDVCVAGQIFASPSPSQVLAGLRALESPFGYAFQHLEYYSRQIFS